MIKKIFITTTMLAILPWFSVAHAEDISIKLLQSIAESGKKELNVPKKLDDDTIVFDILPSTNRIIYNYTLIKYNAEELGPKMFYDLMYPSLVKNYCTNKDLEFFKNNEVDLEHIYFGKDKIVVTAILISPNDCKEK